MSLTYAARDRRLALYRGRDLSVVVDTKYLTAEVATGPDAEDVVMRRSWVAGAEAPDGLVQEIAEAAVRSHQAELSVLELDSSMRRGYTVPKRVSMIAAPASHDRKLSPMSRVASTLLAAGGQVTCADVLWIHRFFEANDADSAGPLKWAAWGGNEGRAWASNLATRLEYDSVTADAGAFSVPGLACFTEGEEHTRAFWGNMVAAGKVDALFRQDPHGGWLLWANGDWVASAGPPVGAELDDQSALFAAGALLDSPDRPVDLSAVDPAEWLLASASLPHLDWELLDRVTHPSALRAAVVPDDKGDGDGQYTPSERSDNAQKQLRGANGRFIQVGDAGAIKSNGLSGTVTAVNADTRSVVVSASDGNSYEVPGSDFEAGAAGDGGGPDPDAVSKPLDLSGILGQPRATKTTPKAWRGGNGPLLKPMGPKQIKQVIDDYEGFITSERQKRAGDFKGGTGWNESKAETPSERKERRELESALDRYNRSMSADAGEAPAPEAAEADDEVLDPLTSDIEPIYLALVDRDDPRAVLDLVAMVPASPSQSAAATYKRAGGEWVADPKILQDLRSPTPPPVVKVEGEEYASVLEQVDSEPVEAPEDVQEAEPEAKAPAAPPTVLSLVSAGGADRNRGNAEDLRVYWTRGEGGAKIMWNTPGDWRRCVRLLSKYLGARSKGYCALRHREMTGMWPGDARNRKEYAMNPEGATVTSLADVRRWPAAIRASAQQAAVEVAMAKVRGDSFVPIPPSAADIDAGRSGRGFRIPNVVVEGLSSGDKRHFRKGSLGIRTLPLPLLWQEKTADGHDNSVIVGRIDHVERTEDGLGNAYGVFDTGPYGREAQRLSEAGMLRWVSVDLDKFEVDEAASESDKEGKMHIAKGRMMAATMVAKPAFQECTIEPLLAPAEEEEIDLVPPPVPTIAASASIAAAIPIEPPAGWFDDPQLTGPTPLRVDNSGRVFGHVATWHTSHIGMAGQTKPPHSRTGYAYFNRGVVRTQEGTDVRVGQLTLVGGHADLLSDASAASKHYDDTASAMADVHAGEDSYGIWVAGALRPGVTPEQVRAFRASSSSGDWRWMDDTYSLELIAVCQVNVPGFPTPEVMVASAAGHPNALVAAGTADLAVIRANEDQQHITALAAAARSRIFLALDVDGYLTEFKSIPAEKRDQLVKEGKALKDGSFPIENNADLRRAVQAYGRAEESKKGKVRRHIVKRARALGKDSLIPKDWKEASLSERSLANRDQYDSLVASARQAKVQAIADRLNRPKLEAEAALLAARLGVTASAGQPDPVLLESWSLDQSGRGVNDMLSDIPEDRLDSVFGIARVEASEAAAHDVIFLENRRTPKVVPKGKKYEPKPSEGKIAKRRPASKDEEKTIRNGGWVRVNEHGKTPKDSDYKSGKKSKIRPQNN